MNNAGFGTYGSFASLGSVREQAEMLLKAADAVDLVHGVLPGILADQAATTSSITYRRTASSPRRVMARWSGRMLAPTPPGPEPEKEGRKR